MTEEQIVRAVEKVSRPMILQYLGPYSCITTTRILYEVFRRFGVAAEPCSVKLCVQMPEHKLVFVSGVQDPEAEEIAAKAEHFEDLRTNGYNGHVVLIVKQRWLVDGSFDQALFRFSEAQHPHGPAIEPITLVLDTWPKKLTSNFSMNVDAVSDAGTQMKIQYIWVRDKSFQKDDAWKWDALVKTLSSDIVQAVKSTIREAS